MKSGMTDTLYDRTHVPRRALATSWRALGVLASIMPLALLGLDLARGLGAVVLAATLLWLALPVARPGPCVLVALGPLVAASTLCVHPLEGSISAPNVLMAMFAWAALAKGVIALRARFRAPKLALPFVVSAFLVTVLAAGWACGRFWLLGAFVGMELLADARAVSPAEPRPS